RTGRIFRSKNSTPRGSGGGSAARTGVVNSASQRTRAAIEVVERRLRIGRLVLAEPPFSPFGDGGRLRPARLVTVASAHRLAAIVSYRRPRSQGKVRDSRRQAIRPAPSPP